MLSVPIRGGLEQPRRLYDFGVIQRTPDELDADWQAMGPETARNSDGRQSADIANSSDGIRKAEFIVEIGIQPAGDNRQRSRYQHVNLREQLVHLLLQNSPDALSRDEIGGADLFIDVAANSARRITQFSNFSGVDQLTKRSSAFHGNDCACGSFPRTFRERYLF